MPSPHGSPRRRLAARRFSATFSAWRDAALLPEAVAEDAEAPAEAEAVVGRGELAGSLPDVRRVPRRGRRARNSHHARHCSVMPRGRPVTSSSSWARRSFGSADRGPAGDELGPAVGADRARLAGEVAGGLPCAAARVEAAWARSVSPSRRATTPSPVWASPERPAAPPGIGRRRRPATSLGIDQPSQRDEGGAVLEADGDAVVVLPRGRGRGPAGTSAPPPGARRAARAARAAGTSERGRPAGRALGGLPELAPQRDGPLGVVGHLGDVPVVGRRWPCDGASSHRRGRGFAARSPEGHRRVGRVADHQVAERPPARVGPRSDARAQQQASRRAGRAGRRPRGRPWPAPTAGLKRPPDDRGALEDGPLGGRQPVEPGAEQRPSVVGETDLVEVAHGSPPALDDLERARSHGGSGRAGRGAAGCRRPRAGSGPRRRARACPCAGRSAARVRWRSSALAPSSRGCEA